MMSVLFYSRLVKGIDVLNCDLTARGYVLVYLSVCVEMRESDQKKGVKGGD